MRIEKIEIIEMAIDYVCKLHKELNYKQFRDVNSSSQFGNSSRNSTDSDNINISSSSTNDFYNKGLNDGMSSILKFLKMLNQIDHKINEQAFDHAEKFKNHVIKAGIIFKC
jgi:hypothetical protein